MDLDTFLTKHDISEQAFAAEINVSQSAVSKYRRKKRMPRPAVVERIERATGGLCGYKDLTPDPAAAFARPKKVRVGLKAPE